ncbi:MAG: hypothetical protein K6E99_01470, partial [Bacilli bacterium]|nr:hypothetical protein [Bacilli bacterium]
MKNVLKLIILFLIISTTRVFAFEEYCVFIESGITVQNCVTGDAISDYSSILTFENDVLTLNEGLHYDFIRARRDITITSNGKKVYLDYLESEPNELTLDRLVSEDYVSSNPNVIKNSNNQEEYTHIGADKLVIKDSDIKMLSSRSYVDNVVHSNSKEIIITNSTVSCYVLMSFNASEDITIDKSTLNIQMIQSYYGGDKKATITESTLNFNIYISQANYTAISIGMSTDIINSVLNNISIISNNNLLLENTKINSTDLDCLTISTGEFVIRDSDYELKSVVLCNYLKMYNSSLKLVGKEASNYNSIMSQLNYIPCLLNVARDLILEDSSLDLDSRLFIDTNNDKTMPAFFVGNSITSNDPNFVVIDKEYNILNVKKVNPSDYGYTVSLSNSNATLYSAFDDEDNVMFNVRTSSAVKYKLKVVNGTWEDGTEEEKEMYLFDGNVPDKNTIKTISKVKGYGLSVTKTGDNEYTYEYKQIVNPKTGIY